MEYPTLEKKWYSIKYNNRRNKERIVTEAEPMLSFFPFFLSLLLLSVNIYSGAAEAPVVWR